LDYIFVAGIMGLSSTIFT